MSDQPLAVRLRDLLDEAMRLLDKCDGQLGLGVYREPQASEQWKDEARVLISGLRGFRARVREQWHD